MKVTWNTPSSSSSAKAGSEGLAGSLARQRSVPETAGTLPTHGTLFVTMLAGVVVIVAGLTFFPALALGPLAEGL